MSLTSGFFNSSNGDRKYDANDFSSIYSGVINDGIFMNVGTCMVVHATTTASQKVQIGIGRAWFNGTWTLNDSIMTITMPNADMLNPRIDAVVLQVDNRDSVRKNSIAVIQGAAAASPTKPTLVKDFATNKYAQYALCYITRPANTNAVVADNIENAVGTDETPFVTGILETVSASELYAQWEAEFTTWQAKWDKFIEESDPDSVILNLKNGAYTEITYSTTDLTAGTSSLDTGALYLVYE